MGESIRQQFDVVVVGAGLSGLSCAARLYETGKNIVVIEASKQAGGRIRSVTLGEKYVGDLGPSWVWPPYQPNVAASLEHLTVKIEPQFEQGLGVLDFDANGQVRHQILPGQHGMMKVSGGPQAFIDALLQKIPDQVLRCDETVLSIEESANGLEVITESCNYLAHQVILAVPMRIVVENINLPESCAALLADMVIVPTWMAAQCKVVVQYKEPFWRSNGLSGRVVSQVGPMVEIHDHCSDASGSAALFGFLGIPIEHRDKYRDQLIPAIEAQLVRCFGQKAVTHLGITIQDWGLEKNICSRLDRQSASAHPGLAPNALRQPHLNDRLYFAVAELSSTSPGLIDGALQIGNEVAERVLAT